MRAEIDAANYCSADADCASAGTECPFGCEIPVNKNEVTRIKQLLDDYGAADCLYDCIAITGFFLP